MPLPRVPLLSALVTTTSHATEAFSRWLTALQVAVNRCAAIVSSDGTVSLTAQTAAIAATTIPILTVTAGLYRVSYTLRVTTAAGVTSSVQLTIGWTAGTVAQTEVGANVNGNTTASHDEGCFLLRADNATTLTYSTAYASNAANAMNYSLDIRVEQLP